MEKGCRMAKFDPFLSLDCARVEGVGAQSKEGIKFCHLATLSSQSWRQSTRDTEFVINFHDWPHISESFNPGAPLPLFSFSKTAEYSDMFYPAWTFWDEFSC